MTDTYDEILETRFAQQRDWLPDPDFADVRRRAVLYTDRRHWPLRRHRRLGVLAAATIVAVIASSGALAYRYLGPSPGFRAGVSAFDELPQAQWPSSMPRIGLARSAAQVGLSATEAESRLRLLRAGLTQGDLYGFRTDSGEVCIFLTGHFGDCLTEATSDREPGVMAKVSPGLPGEDPAVVAVVADNVEAVTLLVDGERRAVAIKNNTAYADLPNLSGDETLALDAVYTDGSAKVFALLHPKGN